MSERTEQLSLACIIQDQMKVILVKQCFICKIKMKKNDSNWCLGLYYDIKNNTLYEFRICSKHGYVEVNTFRKQYSTPKHLFELLEVAET